MKSNPLLLTQAFTLAALTALAITLTPTKGLGADSCGNWQQTVKNYEIQLKANFNFRAKPYQVTVVAQNQNSATPKFTAWIESAPKPAKSTNPVQSHCVAQCSLKHLDKDENGKVTSIDFTCTDQELGTLQSPLFVDLKSREVKFGTWLTGYEKAKFSTLINRWTETSITVAASR